MVLAPTHQSFDVGVDVTIDVTITVTKSRGRTTSGGVSGGGGGGGPPPVPVPSDEDFDWNVTRDIEALDGGNDLPTGIWSDGTTLWVVENAATGPDRVFAYEPRTAGERQRGVGVRVRPPQPLRARHLVGRRGRSGSPTRARTNCSPTSLGDGRAVGSSATSNWTKRNKDPRGIWSDGETIYVLDSVQDALFVYDLETGELLAEHDARQAQ